MSAAPRPARPAVVNRDRLHVGRGNFASSVKKAGFHDATMTSMELVWDHPVLDGTAPPTRATHGSDPPIAIHAVDARTRRYEDRSETPWLSLKWLARGKAIYRVGPQRHELCGDALLVLGPCHGYDVAIDEPAGAESFCLFVPHEVAASMWAAVASSSERLLDEPDAAKLPEFPDVVVRGWRDLVARTSSLRLSLRSGRAAADDALQLLLDALVRLERLRDGRARLTAVRASTRAELVRRLQRARDYIDARLPERRPLAEIARVACMAPFHLQRCFAIVYGESPAVYASRRCLEIGAHLVATTQRPLAEIAIEAGFASQDAFTRAFQRWHGTPPGAYRRATRGHR